MPWFPITATEINSLGKISSLQVSYAVISCYDIPDKFSVVFRISLLICTIGHLIHIACLFILELQ